MTNKSNEKSEIIKSLAKILAEKELVRSYIKGKTPLLTLSKKGIKFAKPL